MADGTSTAPLPQAAAPGTADSPAPAAKNPPAKKPWALVAGGTFLAAAAGVAGMNLVDSEPAQAAPEPATGEVRQAAEPQSRVLARLSDGPTSELITYDEVAAEAMARHGKDVLEALINRTTVEMACKKQGVSVSRSEVEAEITATAKKFEVDRATWLQMLQTERGLDPNQYARDVIWPKLALQKLAGTQVTVTPEDVKQAFIRAYGPKVKARMIMLDNIRRAQEVHAEVRQNPGEFGRIAREKSIDPTSQALDGVIPPIAMYGSPETRKLEEQAFALADDQISGIIQLPFPGMQRYVILKREGLTDPVETKLEDVRSLIEEELREQKIQTEVAKVFTEIKDRTKVDNYAAQTSTGGVKKASATR